jgi:DNA-binding response OmpR family regulator
VNRVQAGLSILVVDDEFDVAELLAELLAARGHRVTTAINGQFARGLLCDRDFDLVITDFMMPLVDGIELVQGMRAEARLAAIPVIMISAQRELPPVVGLGLVQALLQKPFTPRSLHDAIAQVTAGTTVPDS